MIFSFSKNRYLLGTFLFLIQSLEVWCESVIVGDEVCVAGYIMDTFCIDRGTLLDRSSLTTLSPEGPPGHSVHCLVDIGVCNSSPFEVLKEMDDGSYGRAWRVDDNDLLLNHARANGVCSTCSSDNSAVNGNLVMGYRATIMGIVQELADGEIPPVIKISSVSDFENFENICKGKKDAAEDVNGDKDEDKQMDDESAGENGADDIENIIEPNSSDNDPTSNTDSSKKQAIWLSLCISLTLFASSIVD